MKRQELIEKWLEALESGEYKQGEGALANKTPKGYEFCCLGVLCMVDGRSEAFINGNSFLPDTLAKKIGIGNRGDFVHPVRVRKFTYRNLAGMNDAGVSFKTIAKIIRKQLAEGNFEKP